MIKVARVEDWSEADFLRCRAQVDWHVGYENDTTSYPLRGIVDISKGIKSVPQDRFSNVGTCTLILSRSTFTKHIPFQPLTWACSIVTLFAFCSSIELSWCCSTPWTASHMNVMAMGWQSMLCLSIGGASRRQGKASWCSFLMDEGSPYIALSPSFWKLSWRCVESRTADSCSNMTAGTESPTWRTVSHE